MKNFFYLLAFALVISVSACGDDDDGSGTTDGTGGQDDDLRIRLTWDQSNSDLDLDIVDGPNGLRVSSISSQHSGDDVSGPGEETIEFNNDAPDGDYEVLVEWFRGDGNVSYTLTIEGADNGQRYSESVSLGSDEDRFTFTKNGGTLEF